MTPKRLIAQIQQVWVERCTECGGTNNGPEDASGLITCLDCGNWWPEYEGKRVYVGGGR